MYIPSRYYLTIVSDKNSKVLFQHYECKTNVEKKKKLSCVCDLSLLGGKRGHVIDQYNIYCYL